VRVNVTVIMKIEDTPFPLTFLVGWIFVNLCQISMQMEKSLKEFVERLILKTI